MASTAAPLRYHFHYVDHCNMCGAEASHFKVLGKRMNRSQGRAPHKLIGISTTIVQCRKCRLIFSNPQPVPFDIQDHYGMPPESYWASEDYFTISDDYFGYELKRLQEIRPFEQGQTALDIGAGLGKCMIALKKAGYDAYGFEPSEPFYRRAIDKMGINPQRLQLAAVEEAQYEDESFDFITFGAVLEHLYDPSDNIGKALRWLKPGGIIQIEVPSADWLINKLINAYYKLRRKDYVGNLSPMHTPFHLYEFGLESFRAHARAHGYEIAFHEYYVCKTYLPGPADALAKAWMKWRNQGLQLCVWLRKPA